MPHDSRRRSDDFIAKRGYLGGLWEILLEQQPVLELQMWLQGTEGDIGSPDGMSREGIDNAAPEAACHEVTHGQQGGGVDRQGRRQAKPSEESVDACLDHRIGAQANEWLGCQVR